MNTALSLARTSPLVMGYLLGHSLASLKSEHGIKTSARQGDLFFSLNYDQIESTPGPMVNQCRGLILAVDEPLTQEQVTGTAPVGLTRIFARPFDRFFNHGDSNASAVDMNCSNTRFYEKLDGTCCIVWWNPLSSQWCVATRAVPLADKPITGFEDLTFRGLFEKALKDSLVRQNQWWASMEASQVFDLWTSANLIKYETYIFELTTPLNRIVVNYPEYTVWLLGIRNKNTGVEYEIDQFGDHFGGVPTCPSHKLNNLTELLNFVGSKAPFEQEGVVVCDNQFRRVKVKSLAYMAYNRVRDSAASSPRALVELILTEKLDDVLPVLEPYIQEKAVKLQDGIRNLFRTIGTTYQELLAETEGHENKRKAFALAVQARNPRLMGYLMDRFTGKCNGFQNWIDNKKNADGSYPDSLLDSLITLCNVNTNKP